MTKEAHTFKTKDGDYTEVWIVINGHSRKIGDFKQIGAKVTAIATPHMARGGHSTFQMGTFKTEQQAEAWIVDLATTGKSNERKTV